MIGVKFFGVLLILGFGGLSLFFVFSGSLVESLVSLVHGFALVWLFFALNKVKI